MSKKTKALRPGALSGGKPFEFNPDYSQVKRDLRRIGVLAAVFVGALVILSFFQEQILALFIK
ncbi:MAG: hypothetical protein ABWK53_03805 [Anaerolineales bacterium]